MGEGTGLASRLPRRAPGAGGQSCRDPAQLDVYGEVMDALYHARLGGLRHDPASWALQRALIGHLESIWTLPDRGSGKYAAAVILSPSQGHGLVALDRAIKTVEMHDWPARCPAGVRCGRRSGPTFSPTDTMPRAAASSNATAATPPTPTCCCCRCWASSRGDDPACSAPSRRSNGT